MIFQDSDHNKGRVCDTLCDGRLTCGSGSIIFGVLPNRLISVCHDGFTHLIKEYKDYVKEHVEL
jgi:hypothetical protein